MDTAIAQLCQLADEVFPRTACVNDIAGKCRCFAGADAAYQELLEVGALHLYAGSLRVFGRCKGHQTKDINWWNDPQTWKSLYGNEVVDTWAFAEDILGNQFVFTKDGIGWLDIETGQIRSLCEKFSDWIGLVHSDPDYYTGRNLALEWYAQHGRLSINGLSHLCAITLFACGGPYSTDNLFVMDSLRHIHLKADIARQIRHLPDGTKIEIKFTD